MGGNDPRPDRVLNQVGDAAILPDGSVAITSRMDRQIKVFSAAGEILRIMGREGSGPGEFRALRDLDVLPSGKLAAWDPQLRRVSFFRTDGQFEASISLDFRGLQRLVPTFVGVFPDESVVVMDGSATSGFRVPPGIRRDTLTFLRLAPNGSIWSEILSVVGPEYFGWVDGQQAGAEALLLGREVRFGLSGDRLVVADTDSLHFHVVTDSGLPLPSISLKRPSRPTLAEDIPLAREERIEFWRGFVESRPQLSSFRASAEDRIMKPMVERVENLEWNPTLPAFSSFLPIDSTEFLIQEFHHPGEDAQRWFLMNGNLSPLGWFEIDTSETLMAGSRERIVVLSRDELDVETVRLLSLDRPGVRTIGPSPTNLDASRLAPH